MSNESSKTQEAYKEVKDQWVSKVNQINQLQDSIQDIDSRLNSWVLSAWEAIGLGVDEVKDDNYLYILDNSKLSKTDLERKKNLLTYKNEELSAELNGLQAVLRQLEADSKAEQKQEQEQKLKLEQEENVSLYYKSPKAFFDDVLFELQPIWTDQKEQIYASAAKIIAASSAFTVDTDREKLKNAWKIVAKARDIAFNDYRASKSDELFEIHKKYSEGARRLFMHLINNQPSGMQGIKFLYDARDHDRADYYLIEAYDLMANSSPAEPNTKAFNQLLEDLAEEVDIASKSNASKILSTRPGFNGLPKEFKNKLIEQQAFIHKLLYDLSFTDDMQKAAAIENLKSYGKLLEDNLTNAIENNKTREECEAAFNEIKNEIGIREREIRQHIFKQQVVDTTSKIGLGTGLGLSWILGAGAPVGLVVGGAGAVAIAGIETARATIPDIEAEVKLAESVMPADYKYIKREDDFWGISNSKPVNEVVVEGASLTEDAKNMVAAKIQTFKDETIGSVVNPINENISKWKAAFDSGYKVFIALPTLTGLGLVVATIVTFAAGLALPPIWPIYTAIGLGLVGGVAIMAAKIALPPESPVTKTLDRIADVLYSPIAFFTQLRRTGLNLKPATEAVAAVTKVEKYDFTIPEKSLQALEAMQPGFGAQLSKHFQRRAIEIKDTIDQAIATNNRAAAVAITADLDNLAKDWQVIVRVAQDPEIFCMTVEDYLDKQYKIERDKFLSSSENIKNGKYDFTKEKKTMLFEKRPEFKMDFSVDYAEERKVIQELHDLKTKVREIKKDF